MTALQTLEKQLAEVFKNAPKLSDSTKEVLAKYWPYIALIGGVLQLIVAWTLFGLTRLFVEPLLDYTRDVYVASTGRTLGPTGFDKTLIYLGIVMLLVDAVILLMAYPKLQQRSKKGWDLLFLAAVLNAVYAVLSLFLYNGGFTSFIGSLIGSAIGFYLLYQVREKYSGGPRIATAKKE
jgi:hypothetical protein